MPRDGNGNYTLPAGNPVVSNTLIEATWANTTMPDLGTETTDSLSRSGKGPMLAPLQIVDADLPTPGLAFQNEPTSGILRQAAGDIRHRVLGTDVVGLTQTTVTAYVNQVVNGTLNVNGAFTSRGIDDTQATSTALKLDNSATYLRVPVPNQNAYAAVFGNETYSDETTDGLAVFCTNTGTSVADARGTNSSMSLRIGGTTALLVNNNRSLTALQVYSTTVGATNRDVFVDNTGLLGYVTSSERYKKNVEPLRDASFLSRLQPVEYDREDGYHETGLIAEQVEKVAPQFVYYDEEGRPDGVDYKGLIVPMLARLQQLEARFL